MAKKLSKIEELRKEVAKAHKRANAKVARVEKSSGVKLAGSEFDARRSIKRVRFYNKRQLESYLGELESFTDRKTQFVAGSGGAPIPKHIAARFENVQRTYNTVSQSLYDRVKDVVLPGGGTIADREATFDPKKRAARARTINRVMGQSTLQIGNVTGVDSAVKLTEMFMQRLRPSDQAGKLEMQEADVKELMKQVGKNVASKFAKLDPLAKSVLLNYTDFTDTMSARYEAIKHMTAIQQASTEEEFEQEIMNVLKWAKKIK